MIEAWVGELTAISAKLRPRESKSGIIRDMREAADDWRFFGQYMLKAHPSEDLSGIMESERETHARLQSYWGDALFADPDYGKILDLGAKLIAECSKREYHPDGYLGCKRIVRETFAFLVSDYGMHTSEDEPFNYVSPHLRVELWCPGHDRYVLVHLEGTKQTYYHEDVRFMAGQPFSSLELPVEKASTEAEMQAWFTGVADMLRQYAADLLANKPDAFERLEAAQAERDRLIVVEWERQWQEANPGQPVPKWTPEHGWTDGTETNQSVPGEPA